MSGSALLVREFFQSGDERFLSELESCTEAGSLKSFAEPFHSDRRPFARQALLTYASRCQERRGHRALVKALFKKAEAAQDDELLAVFLVAFDGFRRRVLVRKRRYDIPSRSVVTQQRLVEDRALPHRAPKDKQGKPSWHAARREPGVFSHLTRRYLQRRAWRYFRKLGHRDVPRYRKALLPALLRYEDANLDTVPKLLDSWGLVNALYGASPVLVRAPRAADVRAGHTLEELTPAPFAPAAWKDCFDDVLTLFLEARCAPVRRWALALLRRDYLPNLRDVPLTTVRRVLRHPADDAKALGVELLRAVPTLPSLPIDEWLGFLALEDAAVVGVVVELFKQHVSPARLSLAQCVALGRSPVAPVAELGASWARARPLLSLDELDAALPLLRGTVAHVRADAATWLAGLLNLAEGDAVHLRVRELLDATFDDVRRAGLGLLEKDRRFGDDVRLWQAMAESPWPDVREALLPRLATHGDRFSPASLQAVWASTLLAVRKGSRHKRAAALQVAERLATHADEAAALLPLLAHALRSIRPPERRAALASVAQACFRAPALQAQVAALVPELSFDSAEVAW